MRILQTKFSRDGGSDLNRRPAKPSVKPVAQCSFLTSRHPGMATFPAINRKRPPAVLPEGLVPAPNRIVVQVQKLGDHLTGFAIIQKKDRIRTSRNTVILAMTAHAGFKLATFRRSEKTGMDHWTI